MNDVFSRINADIDSLKINAYTNGLMELLDSEAMSAEQLEAVALVFDHLPVPEGRNYQKYAS